MNKITLSILIVLIFGFIGLTTWSMTKTDNTKIDYEKYDLYSVIGETDAENVADDGSISYDNGGIADHVKGNKDAKVLIYEYADYQCPGCATVNPWINALLEEYTNGEVGIVYRTFLLSYHQNAKAAAAAAEAAGLQGYWKKYGDLLFANQEEWEYAEATERGAYFTEYFNTVSNGEGDVEQFQKDMESDNVIKKVEFDVGLANRVGIEATPAFYIDGELIDWYDEANTKSTFVEYFKNLIDAKLAE